MRFCTDGRLTAARGISTFGFSPCEAKLAHTVNDIMSIKLMEEAMWGYGGIVVGMRKKIILDKRYHKCTFVNNEFGKNISRFFDENHLNE
jgi:hypothetical protein